MNCICYFIAPEKHRGAPQFFDYGPEGFNPGISVFKGQSIKVRPC